jgi:hypothetical protein
MRSVAPKSAALDGQFYGREALTFRVHTLYLIWR